MRINIATKLLATFALMFAVLVVMGGISLWTMAGLNGQVDRVASVTATGVAQSGRIRHLVSALEAGMGRVVILTAKSDAKGTAVAASQLDATFADLNASRSDLERAATDQITRAKCAEMQSLISQWKESLDLVKSHAQKGEALEAADATDKANVFAGRMEGLAAAIETAQANTLASTRSAAAADYGRSWWILVGVTLAALAAFGGGWWIVRSIRVTLGDVASRLRLTAGEVVAAAGQVAGSSGTLSKGATTQAASLEETSASMEEVASMTRRNAENSQAAAGRVAETERLVGGANAALTDLVASMREIRDSSSQVTKIIKTIDEIAFQTNILALNAAVEAARAGEAGMGFAVVAEEVRNLAQRSAQAAKDTALLVENSATSARTGATKVDAVVGVMTSITESSVRAKGLIDDVSAASQQQTQGIDHITQSVSQMERVTQETAAHAEEGAAAAEELNAHAQTAMDLVAQLESLVGSDARTAAGGSQPAGASAVSRAHAPAVSSRGAGRLRAAA